MPNTGLSVPANLATPVNTAPEDGKLEKKSMHEAVHVKDRLEMHILILMKAAVPSRWWSSWQRLTSVN